MSKYIRIGNQMVNLAYLIKYKIISDDSPSSINKVRKIFEKK